MDALDLFFKKYAYKFPKGYPDMNNEQDINILADLLENLGVNFTQLQLNEDKDDEIANMFSYIGDENQLTKIQVFDKLAEYTLKYHSAEMGELKTLFPEVINTISGKTPEGSWRDYAPKRESNIGKEIETCIINYSNESGVKASDVANKGRGEDALIGGKTVEIKSSKDNKINTQLQTTYYSADKFYAFVTNTSSKDIQIRIVYGKLLRELSFGQEIASKNNIDEIGKTLEDQIKAGLEKLNFTSMIKTSLVQGPTDRETSFKIGNKLKVRFVIYFEPTYGKGKSKGEKSIDEDEE
jgi:hypothetical protein